MTRPAARYSIALVFFALPSAAARGQSFVNFESAHVRPLALSPGGALLFAVNTPDNRVAVYAVGTAGLTPVAEVPVGLEPVAVAARTNLAGRTEAWVVNHLSDSVSIVEVDPVTVARSRVTRTLLVGDEPRDIVFGGRAHDRAFITCAHRGQNRPGDPQLTTPGIGRADVWAFDADDAGGSALGGGPIVLFGDTPRALATSPDGSVVYAAVFQSGNRTTTITQELVSANGGLPPPPPGGRTDGPHTGLIVQFDGTAWRDEIGSDWNAQVAFSLPDLDVFLIDADANPPGLRPGANAVRGVGTILFNMATRPTNGKLYVANTEALNQVRFGPMVNGHLAESRITVVTGTSAAPRHLNPHIDYGVVPGPPAESATTLAFPMDLAFSADGRTLFVAGFGSGRIGVLDADDLERGIITKSLVPVGAGPGNGGPTGLALDAARDRLYVMNRFDQTISIVSNLSSPSRGQTAIVPLGFDPSPPAVRNGRRFLYDAAFTSSHGDSACASCHVFGDFDGLAWDLGDPFGTDLDNPNPFRVGSGARFHPMKGPMTTQSLRGMAAAGPMHWRGDRTGGNDPGGDALDEDAAFEKFNPAFVTLLGRETPLTAAEMRAFRDFILTVTYPPNPLRALDGSLTPAQSLGSSSFRAGVSDAGNTCLFCHRLPLGTDGLSSVEGEPQEFKIPHLRNLYQKVGMFGVPPGTQASATGFLGDQVRGFGFLHDGSIPTVFDFLQSDVFTFDNNNERRHVEDFMLVFDTGLRPIVGQQVSATPATFADASITDRINALMIARTEAGDCDLVVKGNLAGQPRGWLYDPATHLFRSDRVGESLLSEAALRAQAGTAGQERTYTAVPPGSGIRIALDRDEDGFFDRTELDAGSDPADPASIPAGTTTTTTTPPPVVPIETRWLRMRDGSTPPPNPAARQVRFLSSSRLQPESGRIVPPALGSAGDPTLAGATLRVYNSGGSGELVQVDLPAAGWRMLGTATSPRFRFRGTDAGHPIRTVVVKGDRIRVIGCGSSWGYTLDEPAQTSIAVRLTLGSAVTWCAEAGRVPSPPRRDTIDEFIATPRTPAPAQCPPLP